MKNIITVAETNISLFKQCANKGLYSPCFFTRSVYVLCHVGGHSYLSQTVKVHVAWENRDIFSLWEEECKTYKGGHFPDFFRDMCGEDSLVFYTR